jgi:cytochrome bd-type quinol oxidase subunit 2
VGVLEMAVTRKVAKLARIYPVFLLPPLTLNMAGELAISPTNRELIRENGWADFAAEHLVGIVIFFALISLVGSILLLKKKYRAKRMGLISLAVGFFLEFALMRPEWVESIYDLTITGSVIGALIVSSLYWFILWGIPAYLAHRFLAKDLETR